MKINKKENETKQVENNLAKNDNNNLLLFRKDNIDELYTLEEFYINNDNLKRIIYTYCYEENNLYYRYINKHRK